MKKTGRCILVCAGDLEISDIPVREEDLLIAVDGGYMYCNIFELVPDVVIGDFDSLEEKYVKQIEADYAEADDEEADEAEKRLIRLKPEKDDTDTLAALRYGLEQGFTEFHLYGAMGGRLEHTIANLQCLHFLKNAGAKAYIWDGCMMMTLIQNESISFREEMEGMISVFAVGGTAKGVSEKGLKYELTNAVIKDDFPVGISNEFIGEKAELAVEDGTLLVIVRWA